MLNIVNLIIRQKKDLLKRPKFKHRKFNLKKEKNKEEEKNNKLVVGDLVIKALTLVRTMLDDNDPQTTRVARQVVTILDLEAIFSIGVRLSFATSIHTANQSNSS